MSKTATIALALLVGLAVGIPLGGRLMPSSAEAAAAGDGVFSACRMPSARRTSPARTKSSRAGRKISARFPGTRSGRMEGPGASSPRARIACICSAAASCRTSRARRRNCFPRSGRTCSSRSPGCRGATRTPRRRRAAGGSGQDPAKGMELWRGSSPPYRELGVDARWEHCIVVVDAQGNIIEEWTQWDKMFQRPHAVYISPYDPEKHVWVVDDHTHAIYKFTNDGKQLVQTIGTPERAGRRRDALQPADVHRRGCPTAPSSSPTATTARASRSSTRTASSCWISACEGEPGQGDAPGLHEQRARRRRRSETRRVFVNDRDNHRVQVFDENGKYLSEWRIAVSPSSLHFVHIGADRTSGDLRSQHAQDAEVRPRRPPAVRVGHRRRFPGHAVGRARHEHRPGRQPLRRRGGHRALPEVPAARRARTRRTWSASPCTRPGNKETSCFPLNRRSRLH